MREYAESAKFVELQLDSAVNLLECKCRIIHHSLGLLAWSTAIEFTSTVRYISKELSPG